MKPNFDNASESFKRLNPHLFNTNQIQLTSDNDNISIVNRSDSDGSNIVTERAKMMMADVPESTVICRGFHLGEPMAKMRPRFSPRGHAYTPQSTKEHQASLVRSITRIDKKEATDSSIFGVRAIFYVQTHQRKDVDNLLKLLLDAFNGVLFSDDSKVKEVMGWSVIDMQNPRTEFVVYTVGNVDRAAGRCVKCGKEFRSYASWKNRLFCSRSCWTLSQNKGEEVPCSKCGKTLVRAPSERRTYNFCSQKCRGEFQKESRTNSQCAVCAAIISLPPSQARDRKFCSQQCYNKFKIGRKINAPAEKLSLRSVNGWITRRKNKTATSESAGSTGRSRAWESLELS